MLYHPPTPDTTFDWIDELDTKEEVLESLRSYDDCDKTRYDEWRKCREIIKRLKARLQAMEEEE
jgi:hypothetical protein